MSEAITSHAQYRVKPGGEAEFAEVLRQHGDTLRSLGLITDRPIETFVGEERGLDGPYFVELFEWADQAAVDVAHTHPQVSAHWEVMGALCEERGGRPMFEFTNLRPLEHT